MSYLLNEKYFNVIDSPEKTYWLGFIWGDGYVAKRERGNFTSYEFKLSLSEQDVSHLFLFNSYLDSTYPIKIYPIKSGFEGNFNESRLFISKKLFGESLYNLGIQPRRKDSSLFNNLLQFVPFQYYKDLIRGIFDADGSIFSRDISYTKRSNVRRKEYSLSLMANPDVLDLFNDMLFEAGITETRYKQTKRHKNRDGNMLSLRVTGNNISERILDWLYQGKSNLSLERKYQKYMELKSYMDSYRREKCNV